MEFTLPVDRCSEDFTGPSGLEGAGVFLLTGWVRLCGTVSPLQAFTYVLRIYNDHHVFFHT